MQQIGSYLNKTNTKNFIQTLNFENIIKRSLLKKGIICSNITSTKEKGVYFLNADLFFTTRKIMKLRKKVRHTKKKMLTSMNLPKILNKNINVNLTCLKFKILNKNIDIKDVKKTFEKFKEYKNVLFARRFSLFIDFLKLTFLFKKQKLKIESYLSMLASILVVLPKNKHNKYLTFLKYLFNYLVLEKGSKIKGIKFKIQGRLKGKLRASSAQILMGKIPSKTISANLKTSKLHVYTIYGALGLKLWVNFA